ncbi:hypothetical protein [Rhodococcoides fascians]|uniref:hypothetical protein n=1 Tax=Rhodococcoides fascians TaxID=1828 RepID=UPI00050C6E6D|nr:hypothetical protein [Rhodococcus fascians]
MDAHFDSEIYVTSPLLEKGENLGGDFIRRCGADHRSRPRAVDIDSRLRPVYVHAERGASYDRSKSRVSRSSAMDLRSYAIIETLLSGLTDGPFAHMPSAS